MTLKEAVSLIEHRYITAAAPGTWADLGCGDGLFTYALANVVQTGSSILAIDKAGVTVQRRPNPANIMIESRQMDFLQTALPRNDFTGIMMANSFHYVATQSAFLLQLKQHLLAEGMLAFVEYDITVANRWVPYPVGIHRLQEITAAAGYTSFTLVGTRPSAYQRGNLYSAIVQQ